MTSSPLTPRRWFTVFIAVLLVTAAALFVGLLYSIRIVQQPDYPRSVGDWSIEAQATGFKLHDRRCDILIYGDSTAAVGLDPRVITAATGLPACNIATNRPDVDVLGTLSLDSFLAHNPRPRLLVFRYGPETFYRAKSGWEHSGAYDPLVMLCRNKPLAHVLGVMMQHPAEAVQFESQIIQTRVHPHVADKQKIDAEYVHTMQTFDASGGLVTLDMPAEKTCRAPVLSLWGPVDRAWVAALRAKYETGGTKVLVTVAPVPDCDPQLELFRRDLMDLAPSQKFLDGPLETFPIQIFLPGNRHVTEAGAAEVTSHLNLILGPYLAHPNSPEKP